MPTAPPHAFELLGRTPAMEALRSTLQQIAETDATVLIRGESGTGKELVARQLHAASRRAERPFVKVDCTALPEALFENELFGHERGAFTGAVARKPGRVELADTGTLFLDEVGELPLATQAKLLRLLQDREVERLGGTHCQKLDLRVIAATHRDLDAMVGRQEFRLDLFYRLNVLTAWLPPLRARRDDIALLARSFAASIAAGVGRAAPSLADDALALLRAQRWPGNVRQLHNLIERVVLLRPGGVVHAPDLTALLAERPPFQTESSHLPGMPSAPLATATAPLLDQAAHAAERSAIEAALVQCGGNRTLAARALGISRSTLYAKLDQLGIPK